MTIDVVPLFDRPVCPYRSFLVNSCNSFDLALVPELLEVGPNVADFFLIFDPRENHPGIGDFAARVLDVFPECLTVLSDAGVLEPFAITVEARHSPGLAPIEAIELWAELCFWRLRRRHDRLGIS
jgi:hypothetical protein